MKENNDLLIEAKDVFNQLVNSQYEEESQKLAKQLLSIYHKSSYITKSNIKSLITIDIYHRFSGLIWAMLYLQEAEGTNNPIMNDISFFGMIDIPGEIPAEAYRLSPEWIKSFTALAEKMQADSIYHNSSSDDTYFTSAP